MTSRGKFWRSNCGARQNFFGGGSETPGTPLAPPLAASNNRDHPTRSLYYCLFAPHTYIFSSRTSRSWWITQSTQHHRRGCNTWHNSTVLRLHHRQSRSHGAEVWRDASVDNKWMIVQCATFFKSLNLWNIVKSGSDIRIRIRFPFLKQFLDILIRLQTHYRAGYPTGKPDSDHLRQTQCCRHGIGLDLDWTGSGL